MLLPKGLGGHLVVPLSPRLAAIASLVPAALPMADIGTDHGFLPIHLLLVGKVPRAFALDRRRAPLLGAIANASASGLGLEKGFVARQSEGLAALLPGEAHTAVLAGLGGALIARVLDHPLTQPGAAGGLGRVIAQPNLEPERVRAWAVARGWRIEDEVVVADGGRLYPTLVLEPGGAPAELDPLDLAFGPVLRARRTPLFLALLTRQRDQLARALSEAVAQASDASIEDLRRRVQILEAELARG